MIMMVARRLCGVDYQTLALLGEGGQALGRSRVRDLIVLIAEMVETGSGPIKRELFLIIIDTPNAALIYRIWALDSLVT